MSKFGRFFLKACAGFVASTVILQFVLGIVGISAHKASIAAILETYFSSFTILSNILAAIAFDVRRLQRSEALTAISTYLVVVALVYFAEFHGALETKSGVGMLTDAAIHDINPLLMLVVWLSFVARGSLPWRSPLVTLAFPLVYLGFVLARGSLTGIYPYPFLDASVLGYARTSLNAARLLGVYVFIGVIFVLIDRALGRFCGPIDQPVAEA